MNLMNPMYRAMLELEYRQDDMHRALRWADNERLARIARRAPAQPNRMVTWLMSHLRSLLHRPPSPEPEPRVRVTKRRQHHHA
jgi:hypothetical protein